MSSLAVVSQVSEVPSTLYTESQDGDLPLHKSVQGRYQDGTNEYTKVGVLMIKWTNDDLDVDSEIEELEQVFRDQFGFHAEIYTIPADESNQHLYQKMTAWSGAYDGPHALSIIYYAGHGAEDHNDLRVQGSRGEEHAQIFFNQATRPLALVNTDTLLILDCCYAATAFSGKRIGKRKFELLSSVSPRDLAVAPNNAGSFTKALSEKLGELHEKSGKRGFTTSELYAALWKCTARHPFLFDQSQQNYGWIRLSSRYEEKPFVYDVAVDVRLHMIKSPDFSDLYQLASSMQYLPLVKKMDFQNLHAPKMKLDEYLLKLRMAQKLKPLLKRVRLRLADQLNEEKGMEKSGAVPGIDRNDLTPDNEDLLDWSQPEQESSHLDSTNPTVEANGLLQPSQERHAGANAIDASAEGITLAGLGSRRTRGVLVTPKRVICSVLRFWCATLDAQLTLLRRLLCYLGET